MDFENPSPSTEMSNQECQENNNKHKEMISTLPRVKAWRKSLYAYKYQGFWGLSKYLEGVMEVQQHFKAQPTDVILCSSPKTGTTWLEALIFAIMGRTKFDLDNYSTTHPLLTKLPHQCVPNLELNFTTMSDIGNRDPAGIPLFATHIPYNSLPESVMKSGCKIVYIWRDPKDVVVSVWHFVKNDVRNLIKSSVSPEKASVFPLDEVFERFCEGISPFGPYWEHVLDYWKASQQFSERILFLKYEDLVNETLFHVKRLAEFIDQPFSEEEDKREVAEKILKLCSFENLSNLVINKTGTLQHRRSTFPMAIKNSLFFRKGKAGDWRNHLSPEMAARLDRISENKFGGSGLNFQVQFT